MTELPGLLAALEDRLRRSCGVPRGRLGRGQRAALRRRRRRGAAGPSPTPQLGSLEELVSLLVRLFDEGHVRPDPDDPRVASLRGAPATEEIRRLTRW